MVISVEEIEHKIRMFTRQKRIRLKDFFVDWDGLRSGYVTKPRFNRCIDKALLGISSMKLTPQDIDQLAAKYLNTDLGEVCYRDFVETIEESFEPGILSKPPQLQVKATVPFLGTERSQVDVRPDERRKVYDILVKIAHYYHYRSMNIRATYWDFDLNKSGFIQSRQFVTFFPGPPEVKYEEIMALSKYYQDPLYANRVNYLNFRDDIAQVIDELYKPEKPSPPTPVQPEEPVPEAYLSELQRAVERIRVMVHKNGIRTTEFFKDHDPLRSYIISRKQFVDGLYLCCGREAQLSKIDVENIANFYSIPDGRVHYQPFCHTMEHAYNVPALAKKPTVHPVLPPRGALGRTLNSTTVDTLDEKHLQEALGQIKSQIRKRRMLLQPNFKDYDRSVGYTRVVTRKQFESVLSFFNVLPAQQYCDIICRRFADPTTGDVNYPAFCEAVDHEFVHSKVDAPKPAPKVEYVAPPRPLPVDTSKVDIEEILRRIRHFVVVNRVRISEFFRDWDEMRSGLVTKTIFARCLQYMGVDWLSPVDVYSMQKRYKSPQKPDMCSWFAFKAEIESKIEPKDLEKDPNKEVASIETHVLPKVGAVLDTRELPRVDQLRIDAAISRMAERAVYRSIDLRPVFQDWDPLQNGHVTQFQWRQVLSMLEFPADDNEFEAIRKRFSDEIGFDYRRFMHYMVPLPVLVSEYPYHIDTLHKVNEQKKPPELNAVKDIRAIIAKIKIRVKKDRARAHEFFKDYDKLRSGLISKINFTRALDLMKLGLKESEIEAVTTCFTCPIKPDFVMYWPFCDEIESIFTLKHLDKNPLVTPVQFNPPVDWHANNMDTVEDKDLHIVLTRIAKYVGKNRTQLFPFFRDYDVTHNGHCTKNELYRVLSVLDMNKLVSNYECELIGKRFQVIYGEQRDVNYEAFCNEIYDMSCFEPNRP